MRSHQPSAAATARKSHVSHTPCERQILVFAWCARRVRCASRYGGRWSIRLHHCARFPKPCAMV
eukprot:10648810-Lingulodinium_polyedra.AAC.1